MSLALNRMVTETTIGENPIGVLYSFLDKEERLEESRNVDKMYFVGYVLELGYESARIITSDPYKLAVGGIPRGSFLIMAATNVKNLTPHFTLLRVTGVSPTPLSNQVQQTYFELHKKSMPELDVWTQSELQWGALDCDVLGMFYANPNDMSKLEFSSDVNNVVSAHRYKVYAPDEQLLSLIVNGIIKPVEQFEIGQLRTMECKLRSNNNPAITTPVNISLADFKGCRTAMFGKTRLGKSNVVKLIAQGILESTKDNSSVGQLIFDINGEYANDNPQDGNTSIRSAYEERSIVYALSQREETPSKSLRLNFYENPSDCIEILSSMLEQDGQSSNYIKSFASVSLPSIDSIKSMEYSEKTRARRKILIYWAILKKAGFKADESRLKQILKFDPGFNKDIRSEIYGEAAPEISNLEVLSKELEEIASRNNKGTLKSKSSSGNSLFDSDDLALLNFLSPKSGTGPSILRPYMIFHDPQASKFIDEILDYLDKGQTVILDLGNATDTVRRYFADMLSKAVFNNQEKKFVSNNLNSKYVQLYFEEAHNLFPPESKDLTGVYARIAKEGAKFHIGMVYSTQSPSTINKDLLAQTENFFVGHLSSQDEVKALSRVQIAFSGIEQDILRSKTPGYMRMLTLSHRFVISVQAHKFEITIKK
ncbi:ATP-binding protein [Francisella philomiragia]|uniref:AAA-like domain protein n=1 Tax=Francisella philomiragia TaxID=28110 RepID=A0AAW3DAV8_9GAMM|nr:DUF87 domain-containing protein [Francisella philomiragia]KFJ42625.1 AAA-like domain protein [Francisella philomiragia]MBK2254632.1 ATP-binding protein [Francisella philomiragia]MBK2273011.1 ATP-binding protein [Francisella philomiragia]MBK2276852.1 ATP-binding protein [Francisella philomiragia]MBK2280564.1 ATP-binding protein [Francisella philomiragia]